MRRSVPVLIAGLVTFAAAMAAQTPSSGPYRVVNTAKVGGEGGWDYVYADVAGRRLYIPRSGQGDTARVTVFDLDTMAAVGTVAHTTGVHGAAVDPKSGHGFASSNPVVMWDTKTLATIKTIEVQGRPDGILFDPFNQHVHILSHSAPNDTVINAVDGSIVGTVDLGGQPEQAQSDGQGHVYIDLEDKNQIAVLDATALKVTAHYDLGADGDGPSGLGLDAKNHVLFAACHSQKMVMLTTDGKILTSLPIGNGVDGAGFNPNTMEAFSSQSDGTLTVIKENSATSFAVEQTVKTMAGARTMTIDTKTNHVLVISAEYQAAPAPAPAASGTTPAPGRGRGGRAMVPDSFSVIVVGR